MLKNLALPNYFTMLTFYTFIYIYCNRGFPGGTSGKEPSCQYRRCKRPRLDPWVGKIPWRRARHLLHQCSCLENPHGERILVGGSP